jgi:hypothetical protein
MTSDILNIQIQDVLLSNLFVTFSIGYLYVVFESKINISLPMTMRIADVLILLKSSVMIKCAALSNIGHNPNSRK